MGVIHTQFGVLALFATIGGLFRHVMGLRSDQIQVVTRMLTMVTLPFLTFKTFSSIDSWPPDANVFFISCVAAFILQFSISFVVFRNFNEISPQLILSTINYNIGVFFYPIMNEIAGVKGTQKLAFFDFLNAISLCIVVPFLLYFLINHSKKDNETVSNEGNEEMSTIEMEETNQSNQQNEKNKSPPPFSQPIFGNEGDGFTKRFFAFCRFMKPILLKLLVSPFAFFAILGLIFGLNHIELPTFFQEILNVGSRANTFVSFFSIGVLFDYHIPLRYIKPGLLSLMLRYLLGFAIGMSFYVVIPYVDPNQKVLDEYSRLVLLIVFIMPPAIMSSIWCVEFGLDSAITSALLNCGTIISFVCLLVVLSIVDVPSMESSSS